MNPVLANALHPVFATITILAVLALIVLVLTVIAKIFPQTTARFKAMTPWMCWTDNEAYEDEYTNFVIHPANYIKVPTR